MIRRRTVLTVALTAIMSIGVLLATAVGAGIGSAAPQRFTAADDATLSGASTWNIPSTPGPRQFTFPNAFGASLRNPNMAPAGSNDWKCIPKPGQNPVVLVHGTWFNAYTGWSKLSPSLKKTGFCVFALNYGITTAADGSGVPGLLPGSYGTGDIPTSARQLAVFVDKVRAATGSSKVTLIGHSQGGTMARQYLKFDGGASKVDRLITISATNHGTTLLGVGNALRAIAGLGVDIRPLSAVNGVGASQQIVGSSFLKNLNAGGDTMPGVGYTAIATTYDEVSTPYDATFLRGPDVRNITLQKGCARDTSDHFSILYSPRLISIVLNTLGARRSDGVRLPVVCAPNAWLLG